MNWPPDFGNELCRAVFAASLAAGGDVKALLNHDQTGYRLAGLQMARCAFTDSEAGLDMRIQLDRANSMHKDVLRL